MKLALLSAPSKKIPAIETLVSQYCEKIRPMVAIEMIEVKARKLEREQKERKRELQSAALIEKIQSSDHVILFDETGLSLNSQQFSKRLVRALTGGKRRTVCIIGGAYGVSEKLKARADETWSLSELTLAHPIAIIVALEQLYRGLAIWKGLPYHNE